MSWLYRLYRWWWPDGFIGDWYKEYKESERNLTIEECAKVADQFGCYCSQSGAHAAVAIRALKKQK